jgi:hypothetical protein
MYRTQYVLFVQVYAKNANFIGIGPESDREMSSIEPKKEKENSQ